MVISAQSHLSTSRYSKPEENSDIFESHIVSSSPSGPGTTNMYFLLSHILHDSVWGKYSPNTDFFAELHTARLKPFFPVLTRPVHRHVAILSLALLLVCPLVPSAALCGRPSSTQNASSPSAEMLRSTSCASTPAPLA